MEWNTHYNVSIDCASKHQFTIESTLQFECDDYDRDGTNMRLYYLDLSPEIAGIVNKQLEEMKASGVVLAYEYEPVEL